MMRFPSMQNFLSQVCALLLVLPVGATPVLAQVSSTNNQADENAVFVLKVDSDLVLTNVVARDAKTGELVTGLKASDFTIYENGKQQKLSSFDFESVEKAAPLREATVTGLAASATGDGTKAVAVTSKEELRNHRLILFFFDLTSLQSDDLTRAVDAARTFLKTKVQPADLVALVSLGNTLKVDQDFTADHAVLLREIGNYDGTSGQGFASGATSNSNQTEDASGYTADESEYNDLNTDRELFALRAIAKSLERVTEKKSLIFFSGGISRDGVENQASLRAAINAAVRANLSIYSVDARGLQAISPLGDASTGSLRGTGAFNGGAMMNNMNANFASQEVMATLSSDTGGKAFFDSNDFAPAFAQVQRDTAAYYALGFHSSNPARDGKYRKLTIRLNRSGVKLEYRAGYYAPADYHHSGKEDRERELEEQLESEMPATDLPLYLDAHYFREDAMRFYVPVSILVPGSQIPFAKGAEKGKVTLDVIGEVLDENKRPVGQSRDTVKLDLDASSTSQQRNVQYNTSFKLAPGKYHMKFVVRENLTGKMGSFENDLVIPDLKKDAVKLSTIVLASHRDPVKKLNPLVRSGLEYEPNITHVFRTDQHLYLLYELYSPKHGSTSDSSKTHSIRVLSNLELIRDGVKVTETPLAESTILNTDGRDAVAIEVDLPLAKLKPGTYIGQLNVIDDVAGTFAFPRFAVLIKDGLAPTITAPVPTPSTPLTPSAK